MDSSTTTKAELASAKTKYIIHHKVQLIDATFALAEANTDLTKHFPIQNLVYS